MISVNHLRLLSIPSICKSVQSPLLTRNDIVVLASHTHLLACTAWQGVISDRDCTSDRAIAYTPTGVYVAAFMMVGYVRSGCACCLLRN